MQAKIYLLLLTLVAGLTAAGQTDLPPTLPNHWLKTAPSSTPRQWGSTTPVQWGSINDWPVARWTPATEALVLPLAPKAQRQATVFTVYHPAAGHQEQAIWTWESTGQSRWILTDQRLADLRAAAYLNFTATQAGQARLSTYFHQYGPQAAVAGRLLLGSKPADQQLPIDSWTGLLAECILYEYVLSARDQRKVESYLALKYGLTLRQDTSGTDYLHSGGQVVWNQRTAPGFHHRLTGIGQDQHWQWSQRQARSSEGGSLLRLSAGEPQTTNAALPDSLSEDFTVIVGDNDAPLNWSALDQDFDILERQWLVQSWQTPPKLRTQIALEAARWEGPQLPESSYWLAINRSGQDNFDPTVAEYIPLASRTPNQWIKFVDLVWDTDGSGSDRVALLRERPPRPAATRPSSLTAWAYPNPVRASQQLQWQLWLPSAEAVDLRLVNAQGQILQASSWPADTYLQASLSVPEPGLYWLQFRSATQSQTLKLIVQ